MASRPTSRSSALHVNGGIRIACRAASQHGYKVDENVVERYTFERKTHNAGVFDVYTPRDACLPLGSHHHRSARWLWPRPHHRRLPSCCPVRRRLPDQGQGGPEGFHSDGHDRRQHPRSRGAAGADPRPRRAQDDGRDLWFRYFQPCYQHAGGHPVDVLRLPCCRQGAERRRYVHRPYLYVHRHLC